MTFEIFFGAVQVLFLLYLLTLTAGYLMLNVISIGSLGRYFEERRGRVPARF